MVKLICDVIRYATPLLYASLGVLVMEVSGIVNMGAEGLMIIGCLSAVAASYYTGSVWLGMLIACGVTLVFGMIFTILIQEFMINQIVLGVAFNLVGYGLTTTLNRGFFNGLHVEDTFATDKMGMSAPVYIGLALVAVIWFFFHKTNFGIQLRSVGEDPKVVESVGLNVKKLRYIAAIIASILIGVGGSFLSTGVLSQFTEQMTDGRGYIALAAVTFGKYSPIGTLGGVLIFGVGETICYRIQATGGGFAYEIALMIPYLLTILAMCLFSRHALDPASLGRPYKKGM